MGLKCLKVRLLEAVPLIKPCPLNPSHYRPEISAPRPGKDEHEKTMDNDSRPVRFGSGCLTTFDLKIHLNKITSSE